MPRMVLIYGVLGRNPGGIARAPRYLCVGPALPRRGASQRGGAGGRRSVGARLMQQLARLDARGVPRLGVVLPDLGVAHRGAAEGSAVDD